MRRTIGQIALAVIYVLLALNAWAQVVLVPLGQSGDPAILTALQVLIGIASIVAAWGSWAGTRWAPLAVIFHGLITAAMLVSLDPILKLGPDARSRLWIGGGVVLLWSLAFAWYLKRTVTPKG